jgi:chromate transport protein ChrA
LNKLSTATLAKAVIDIAAVATALIGFARKAIDAVTTIAPVALSSIDFLLSDFKCLHFLVRLFIFCFRLLLFIKSSLCSDLFSSWFFS